MIECYCFLINIIVGTPAPPSPALPRAALIFLYFFVPGCCKTVRPRTWGVVVLFVFSVIFLILAAVFPLVAFKT